jgi:hypothetical protein
MASLGMPSLGFPSRFPYGAPYNPINAAGSADALPIADCVVFVTKAGVDAMTLATPVAGTYPSSNALGDILGTPNDDGKRILIYSTTAQAHTVTTSANKINGSKHIATFAGAIGDFLELIAFNGVWWVVAQLGITLS